MTKAELLKQKHVIVPLGSGAYATHYEDAAGHKYELDADDPNDAEQYRLIKANMSDAAWVDFDPMPGDSQRAKGQAVPEEVEQAKPGAAVVGASDVNPNPTGNVVGATDIQPPPNDDGGSYQPPEAASAEAP